MNVFSYNIPLGPIPPIPGIPNSPESFAGSPKRWHMTAQASAQAHTAPDRPSNNEYGFWSVLYDVESAFEVDVGIGGALVECSMNASARDNDSEELNGNQTSNKLSYEHLRKTKNTNPSSNLERNSQGHAFPVIPWHTLDPFFKIPSSQTLSLAILCASFHSSFHSSGNRRRNVASKRSRPGLPWQIWTNGSERSLAGRELGRCPLWEMVRDVRNVVVAMIDGRWGLMNA